MMTSKNRNRLDPARSIIDRLGVDLIAEITGKHQSRIYRWAKSRTDGGTGGFIPVQDAQALLDYSHRADAGLTPAHFFLPPERANAEASAPSPIFF